MAITTASPVVFAIDEEHQRLDRMYGNIRTALSQESAPLGLLRSLFSELAEEVERHFVHEEDGGYFDEVVEMAPHLGATVQKLQMEHGDLLETLEAMHGLLAEAEDTESWRQAVRQDFEAFLHQCKEHESRENSLVQEAYSQDIGALD
jgi:iron-sulfur cluster repair protein YtfE (RIC family)